MADVLVKDKVDEIAAALRKVLKAGLPKIHRSTQIDLFRKRIAALNTDQQIDPNTLRQTWKRES